MRAFRLALFVAIVAMVLTSASAFAQLHELGTGAPGPIKARHLAQSQGEAVFVDFTAAWCLSCQVNEKAVLQDKSVEDELIRQHYVLLRADWTRYDPEITEALGKIGRNGVPTYVVFSAGADGSSHVLPELLTRTEVLDAIHHAGS
ncbi:MAG: thioredoxin family protein [Edaphobacter sp.]